MAEGAKSISVDYDDQEAVAAALKGQQFLAIVLSSMAGPDTHSNIVKGAIKAGVSYIMPTAYGWSVTNERLAKDDIYTKSAQAKVQEIQSLGGTSIVMVCGFWYEWSLALGLDCFGIDLKNHKAILFDDGNTKINSSTWEQCGRALAALLSLPESGASPSLADWKNKELRIASFRMSQRDMLDSIHRVKGDSDKDWEITSEPAAQRYGDGMTMLSTGDRAGFIKAMYSRGFFANGDGDFETSDGLHNEVLGLSKGDMDASTKAAIGMVEAGWNPWA